MKFECGPAYTRLASRQLGGRTVTAWVSLEQSDATWDGFLAGTDLGQYEQSSLWARAKQSEGWQPLRLLVTLDDQIVGGVQCLWRRFLFWRLGLIRKGPVVSKSPGPELPGLLVEFMQDAARMHRLTVVTIQPPDLCEVMPGILSSGAFARLPPPFAGRQIMTLRLQGDFEAVKNRMEDSWRSAVEKAMSAGVSIRQGTRDDIRPFFELIRSTYERMNSKPNPRTAEALLEFWDAAHTAGNFRLTLAEKEGRLLAGSISIPFGKRVSFWKKAWTASDEACRPNELLTYESIHWAWANGYRECPHVRFGGEIQTLHETVVYSPSAVVRLGLRVLVQAWRWLYLAPREQLRRLRR